jgi:hypothetical protein
MRPYVRAANVTWGGISLDDVKEMNFSPKEFETYELKDGDILLSEASGSASEVGKPAVWRGEVEGCCFQNTLIRVRSRGPLPDYLHLHFLADARLGRFAAVGKGIGINHLGADRMSSWPTMLPPLNEQRRIVAKLEALQARSRRAREALDALPALLEKLRQSILAAAFRGDLTKDWRAKHKDVEPARKLIARTEEPSGKSSGRAASTSIRRGVAAISVGDPGTPAPAGWAWVPLSRVARMESGHTPSRNHAAYWDGGIPWIGIKDARDGHGQEIQTTAQTVSELGLANSSARLLPAKTVCLSRTASVGYVTIMGKPMSTHNAMTVMSTPDCSRCIAVVCRMVCGDTRRPPSDGHFSVAAVTATRTLSSTPERVMCSPRRFAKSGALLSPLKTESQCLRASLVLRHSGMVRSLRPLPMMRTCEPLPNDTSRTRSAAISETRAPVLYMVLSSI